MDSLKYKYRLHRDCPVCTDIESPAPSVNSTATGVTLNLHLPFSLDAPAKREPTVPFRAHWHAGTTSVVPEQKGVGLEFSSRWYELLKNAIKTGNFNKLQHEIKLHIYTNKNIYLILTFFVILYSLYERDNAFIHDNRRSRQLQLGGDKEGMSSQNIIEMSDVNSTHKKTNNINNSTGSKLSQGASGLCDGDGTIAKMCRSSKDGIKNYFMFFGYIILAGLAVLSPFVIYIVLLYMILKLMLMGLKNK